MRAGAYSALAGGLAVLFASAAAKADGMKRVDGGKPLAIPAPAMTPKPQPKAYTPPGICNWCGCQGGPGYRVIIGKFKDECARRRDLKNWCGSPVDGSRCAYEGNWFGTGRWPPNEAYLCPPPLTQASLVKKCSLEPGRPDAM
jgi:hypothetical protein